MHRELSEVGVGEAAALERRDNVAAGVVEGSRRRSSWAAWSSPATTTAAQPPNGVAARAPSAGPRISPSAVSKLAQGCMPYFL